MATLFDSASLVMIPSGYKDDKLYSIKPTDGSGDFTFSRDGAGASPATRVNASGLIEKGRENVLLQSNQFDTTWANASSTDTGGQADKDGGTDAWLLEKSAVNGRIQQLIVSSGVQTYSVYAKAGTSDWMSLMITTATGDRVAFFDLSNGVVGTGFNLIDKNIESVGGGWYRCSITFNETSITARIYVSDADNDNSGTTGNIYIQDAQLEQGLVATDYIETTTAAVSAGLLGDMPRLDYSGGATCPSLLLEPSRVNVLPQSEYLGAWGVIASGTGVNPIRTANAEISPEGVQNAYEVTFNTGANATSSDLSFLNINIGGQGAGDYTLSFYAKVSSGTDKIIVRHAGGFNYTTINLTDQWQRFDITENLAVSGTIAIDIGLRRGLANEPLNSSVTCQIYGIQLEAGSYPTSYIPTYGSASVRGLDSCSKTGISSLIGQTEGTLFMEVNIPSLASAGNDVNYKISDGTSNNEIYIAYYSDGRVQAVAFAGGSLVVNINLPSYGLTTGVHKFALAYKNNDYNFFIDGSSVGTDTSASVPSTSQLSLLQGAGGPSIRYNQAILFKTRLTNAELAALTA